MSIKTGTIYLEPSPFIPPFDAVEDLGSDVRGFNNIFGRNDAQSIVHGDQAVRGALTLLQLATPAAPTVTPITTGATTVGYRVTATVAGLETAASAETQIANSHATLNNTITWVSIPGATGYKVYRSTGGATQGLVGTITNGNTLTFTDTNIVAGAAHPTTNNTGHAALITVALTGGAGSYITLPVLTTAQRDALTAAIGYTIYNSTTGQIENYNGSAWVATGKVYGDATFATLTNYNAHVVDIDAHMVDLFQTMRTGVYLHPTTHSSLWTETAALVADRIVAFPIVVVRNITVDRIAIHVSVAGAAGKVARLGIYNNGTNLYPGTLLLDAGTVAVDSTGIKEITISQALTKGIYFIVGASDGTPTVYTHGPSWTPLGVSATGLGNSADQWYKDAVGAGAFAASFVAGASINTGWNPSVLLRLLSLD